MKLISLLFALLGATPALAAIPAPAMPLAIVSAIESILTTPQHCTDGQLRNEDTNECMTRSAAKKLAEENY